MKRTFSVNVDGQIFHIDEDAFALLENYLQKLKITFTGDEGHEIVADIESRIREHFNERLACGKSVIVLSDVEKVIETMGRPEDLGGDDNGGAEEPQTSGQQSAGAPFISINLPSKKKLYRNVKNKVFGGVFGGLSVYLGWNANIMRILFIVLVLAMASVLKVWPFIIIYLIAWMIIPPALTPRQILQMNGTPVNVDTVGQTVMAESGTLPPPYKENVNFFTALLSIMGKCVIGFIGAIGAVASVASLVVFLSVSAGLVAWYVAGLDNILSGFSLDPMHVRSAVLWLVLCSSLLVSIVSSIITWSCASSIFSFKGPNRITVVLLIIAILMLIVIVTVLAAIASV